LKGRALFVCNDAVYFTAHRSHIAHRLLREGWEVHVAAGGDFSQLSSAFIRHHVEVERRYFSFRSDLLLFLRIRSLLAETEPQIVHLITMKPVAAGTAALLMSSGPWAKTPRVLLTFPGLGRLFDDQIGAYFIPRMIVCLILKTLFRSRNCHATFENSDDRDLFVRLKILENRQTTVLSGAGVELAEYRATRARKKAFRVLWASRLVRGKGVTEFVQAARLAQSAEDEIEFLIAGYSDPGHVDNIPDAEIEDLVRDGSVRFLGHVTDMPGLLASVDALCLPSSYMEGLPRILVEAAAASLPLIASDVPGCRQIVQDGVNGIILPDNSAESIYHAVKRLARDRALANQMGAAAQRRVYDGGFDIGSIQDQLLEIYLADR
jgi:glycosyltransferase involved in cell wall biosynthesis